MKSITIKKLKYTPDVWDQVEDINISTFKWKNTDKAPKTCAKLFYDSENLYIKFYVNEKTITIRHKGFNESVYKDSCVEFFVRPVNDHRYLNFEVNALGFMLLGIGAARGQRKLLNPDIDIFSMKTSAQSEESYKADQWTVEYKIPLAFFKDLYKDFDIKNGFYGNFYKCGDETEYPHYGMWNEINLESPDFHAPEFFGKINTL